MFERGLAVVNPQVIGEFCNAVTKRKIALPEEELRRSIDLLGPWSFGEIDLSLIDTAWTVRQDTGFQWWDCMLLASALAADCRFFLSEDMAHERIVEGVMIISPFAISPSAVFASH